jgi:hypothetical protein
MVIQSKIVPPPNNGLSRSTVAIQTLLEYLVGVFSSVSPQTRWKPGRLTQDTDIHERAQEIRVKLCDNIDKLYNALDLKSAVSEISSRETDLSLTWFLGLQCSDRAWL